MTVLHPAISNVSPSAQETSASIRSLTIQQPQNWSTLQILRCTWPLITFLCTPTKTFKTISVCGYGT